nr:hypothetical protein [Tanacetum cinerariifolium]
GEGSGKLTEPHHTPSPEAQPPSHTAHSSSSLPSSPVPPTIANEPASPQRDISQGEACPTDTGFIADQDRETINKSSTLPHDSAPRVTSLAAVEDTQEVEINQLKERVKLLEEREGAAATKSRDDAPIKGRSMDEGEAATKRVSDDTEEMATVLTSMDAATVLASGVVDVPTGSGSIPTVSTPVEGSVPTGSEEVPTASLVFSTATMVTPVTRRKGKERRAEQIARDAEIARIYAEEELQSMIDGLDRNNETVAKYLEEYHQFSSELPMERRIELISDLVKDFRGMEFEEVEAKSPEEVLEEKVKEMMQLVPIEEVYVEALQVKHPIIDWKDKEIFKLVEKDYPLRKGLALVMICYKLQVENFSQMANDLVLKIYKIANSLR